MFGSDKKIEAALRALSKGYISLEEARFFIDVEVNKWRQARQFLVAFGQWIGIIALLFVLFVVWRG